MNTGVGFTEIAFILLLVLVFFGSKELPAFLRQAGKLYGKVRKYGDQVRRELDAVARVGEPVSAPINDTVRRRKQELRARFRAARNALSDEQREEYSARIADHVMALEDIAKARAVMVYMHTPVEVRTDGLIGKLRVNSARIIVPYCRDVSLSLGIAEITDEAAQLRMGAHSIREPVEEIRDKFMRSDLQAIIVPAVSFDRQGGRLGHGKGYYDNFLRELAGRVPFIGIAFQCQMSDEVFPFDYHDVPMTHVVTEEGVVYNRRGLAG